MQIIDMISEQLLEMVKLHQATSFASSHRLVMTEFQIIPQGMHIGAVIQCHDLRTSHEDIIPQQVAHIAS